MPFPFPHRRACICLIVLAGAFGNLAARAEAPCPELPVSPLASLPSADPAPENPPTEVRAREMRAVRQAISEFLGDVEVRRGGQSLNADQLRHDRDTGQADANGNVVFRDNSGLSFQTQELHINLESRIGHTTAGDFRFENSSARGDAERIDFLGPDRTRLTRARYTTCAPGQDDWFLKIRKLNLDTRKDIGTAYHTSVNFYGLPVFYLPYLNFPISDERKSGFLMPRVGNSDNRGTEVFVPYYLNLAPNYDDTLTPHYMSKRGLQLQNEFRYLTPRSQGQLNFEALPNDRIEKDDRAAASYQHHNLFNSLWSASVNLRSVSDKKYFDDFGDNLGLTSQTHLPQNARVDYRGPRWNFSALAADYQTIDPTIGPADRPYARLPQINLSLNQPTMADRVNYYFETEAVNFDRDVGLDGRRLNVHPSITYPLSNSYGFLTPLIGVRHIAYSLSETPDETPSLTRGIFSLDSGLVFERDSRWGETLFIQTLEPRLYYLYIPRKNQDALPNFDTGIPELSFSNLFRDNRFSGGDRVGDANQITAAVTTRFIDEQEGIERGRASLGRIYYLSDRTVNLPPGDATASASDIVGEAAATLAKHWHARTSAQWNRTETRLEKYSFYFQYNPAKNRILNFGKRFIKNELEQTDISTEWPIAARWTFRARSLYSQRDRRNVESHAGMEYNACCWALRIIAGRRLIVNSFNSSGPVQNNEIMLELELTGLSKLGHVPESPLRESMFFSHSRN